MGWGGRARTPHTSTTPQTAAFRLSPPDSTIVLAWPARTLQPISALTSDLCLRALCSQQSCFTRPSRSPSAPRPPWATPRLCPPRSPPPALRASRTSRWPRSRSATSPRLTSRARRSLSAATSTCPLTARRSPTVRTHARIEHSPTQALPRTAAAQRRS